MNQYDIIMTTADDLFDGPTLEPGDTDQDGNEYARHEEYVEATEGGI